MAARCSVLAWRIPGAGEPGGLLSMGSHRVGHDRRCVTPRRPLLPLFSRPVASDSLRLCGRLHARLPHPSLSPGVCSDSRGLRDSHFLSFESAGFSERLGSLPDGGSGPQG